MQQKFDAGWRFAKRTVKAKKLHEGLIPAEQLSRDEREKDRALVRGIPKILAKAEYTIVKLG